nr:hypothetical protein [Brevibacillus agri]
MRGRKQRAQDGFGQRCFGRDANFAAIQKSALSCNGSKHLIPARVVHKGNGRLTVADEAERDGPHRHALQKVDGSVDGIANPVRGRVFRLFLQGGIKFCIGPAIRGKALRQAVPEQLFCLRI